MIVPKEKTVVIEAALKDVSEVEKHTDAASSPTASDTTRLSTSGRTRRTRFPVLCTRRWNTTKGDRS